MGYSTGSIIVTTLHVLSAILAVGGVHKRAVVVADDAIAVRSVAFLALSFDHRLIDGAIADQFMASVKARLEIWPEGIPGMAVSG